MRIAVLGLGLIGGSLAYALEGFSDARRVGFDPDETTRAQALERGAVDEVVITPEECVRDADLVIYASSPHTIMENMRRTFPLLNDNCIVTEICGVKREMAEFVSGILPSGVGYCGLHPMAGREVGGFVNADKNLFRGAGFILVPASDAEVDEPMKNAVELLTALCQHVGAGRIVVNNPDIHDSIIAYTSDLMHISAAALCDEFMPDMTLAHTAGAFRDCTRVARIDADLWTELLLDNRELILPHLTRYIDTLTRYADALGLAGQTDAAALHTLLARSAVNKVEILTR
ncbi:prephenate dehydrogenase [Clostridia bacterium]|nr:prephenate dehydrogenase [Clostridia bacterium]